MPYKKYDLTKLCFDTKKTESAWNNKTKVTAVMFWNDKNPDDIWFGHPSSLPGYFKDEQASDCYWEIDVNLFDQVKNDLITAGFKFKKLRDW